MTSSNASSNANANPTPQANRYSKARAQGGYRADLPSDEAVAAAREAIPALADFDAAMAAIREARAAFEAHVKELRDAFEAQVAELRAAYEPVNGRMLEALDLTPLDALAAALALREYGEGAEREQDRIDFAEGYFKRYFWHSMGF